jgi:flagellar hook-length control protein FliK
VADLAQAKADAGSVDGRGAGSPVAALAHSSKDAGSGSAVAALAHDDDHRAHGSPVPAEPGSLAAASAHGDPGGAGSSEAESGAAPSDLSGAPAPDPVAGDRQLRPPASGRASAGGDQSTVPALGAEPAWAGLEPLSVPPVSPSGDAPSAGPDRRAAGDTGAAPSGASQAVGPPPARPAEAAAAPATTTPAAAPATVADQIVSAVVPLHGRGDGRHEVTLELRPDDVGAIRVEVSVEHQTVHLTLHAADPATGRLLSAALPDLRSALADAGLTAGHVGVGTGGDGGTGAGAHRPSGDGDRPSGRPPRVGRSDASRPDTAPVRTIRPAAAGRLDLFL